MEGLIMAAQLILGLSILVGLHEAGHMFTAKAFGMRVEQFSIGFPPKIFGFKKGDTEYTLGALPLGGFVKISGMVDESLDLEKLKEEPKEYEFRAKPAWQRLIVMLGGIIVNVITGIVIFVIMVFTLGESYISQSELNKHGIVAYDLAQEIGLQTGDKIIDISGKSYQGFTDLRGADVLLGDNAYYTVDRNGEILKVEIPSGFLDKFSDKKASENFIEPRQPFAVGIVAPGSAAEQAGLKEKDRITKVADINITYFDEIREALGQFKEKEVTLTVERPLNAGGFEKIAMPVQVSEEGTIGFGIISLLEYSKSEYTFAQAIPRGTTMAFEIVWVNIRALGKIFSGEVSASKSISGPIGIAQVFGGTWDWVNFWRITGLLSMILAFMNLLPIPALDGGHVVFLTYEIVSGRKPSDKFLEVAQKVGMVLILGLMVFAIFNDIIKAFFT
jgi:regulator of sigma E protease